MKLLLSAIILFSFSAQATEVVCRLGSFETSPNSFQEHTTHVYTTMEQRKDAAVREVYSSNYRGEKGNLQFVASVGYNKAELEEDRQTVAAMRLTVRKLDSEGALTDEATVRRRTILKLDSATELKLDLDYNTHVINCSARSS